MTDKMTDNEIMQALECLAYHKECPESEECQYYMDNRNICDNVSLAKDALDLINRQNAEIAKKDTEIGILIRKKEALRDEIAEQQSEIDRLKESNKRLSGQMGSLIHHLETAKSEAYEELADKLHDNFISKVQKRYCLLSSNPYKYTEGYTADDVLSTIVNTLEELTRNLHDTCTESNE